MKIPRNPRDPRWPDAPTYHYVAHVVCLTCGQATDYDVYSVNPDKRTYTFKGFNPLTGLQDMPSVWTLPCGHQQDLENHPVERAEARP